jgi:hypothetical protein
MEVAECTQISVNSYIKLNENVEYKLEECVCLKLEFQLTPDLVEHFERRWINP